MAGSREKREGIMEEARFEEPENDPPGHGVVIIFTVFFEAGLAPFSLFLGWLLGHPPLAKFVWSFADTPSSNANTGRVNSLFNPRVSSKRTASFDPCSAKHRIASSAISGGNARTPNSGRSNDAIILNRSICSPADDARPNTCRPVGISRCSISSNCS